MQENTYHYEMKHTKGWVILEQVAFKKLQPFVFFFVAGWNWIIGGR